MLQGIIKMTIIEIPFNGWSLERLRDGRKTATSRNKLYGVSGDTFTIDNMDFEFRTTYKKQLLDIAENHFKEEGAKSQQEFIDVWVELHPKKGFVPNQKVYFHTFKRIN